MSGLPRFCPTCYAASSWSGLREDGLDPRAHGGWPYGVAIRRHGIVRIPQDVSDGRYRRHATKSYAAERRRALREARNGRGSIRVYPHVFHTGGTSHRHAGRVMGRTWFRCPDPWHQEIRNSSGELIENPNPDRPPGRPAVARPKFTEVRERRKAKARAHKARQANR